MEALAFIDLLGFGQMVRRNTTHAKRILNDFYNISFSVIKERDDIRVNLFSDSLLAYSSDPAGLIHVVSEIYRKCLKKNGEYSDDLSKFFLLPRGGISYGEIDIQERTEAPNITKNFIVSPALVHSAKMESKIKGSRLLVADPDNNNNQVFCWNENLNGLLYEDTAFTFWDSVKYYDALWFLDLRKNHQEQKTEVSELIEISIELAKSNSVNKNAVIQHIHTLRIGLLSYSRFLNISENPLLERIMSEFIDDMYWPIWLTIFEVIMQSPDSWVFPAKSEVIEFYRRVCLKESWANVIKEINKPKNLNQMRIMKEFIEEMSIHSV